MSRAAGDSEWTGGGAIPGDEGHPSFVQRRKRPTPIPILIAVPHAGRHYPEDIARRLRHPAEASLRLEDRYVDLVADAVSRQTGAGLIVAHAPRAMIDLNRSPDDMDWDMVAGTIPAIRPRLAAGRRSRSGLGLVPRRLPGMGELWKRRLSREELDARIELVHRPYHTALGTALESLRDRWGAALLLDLHSMPPLGPKSGRDPAVDFVLGDRFGGSCAGNLVQASIDYFDRNGTLAAHNRPYAGGYVLDRHGAPARGLNALQVEICRSAYLDADLRDPGTGLDHVVDVLTGLVRLLAGHIVSDSRPTAQAAE